MEVETMWRRLVSAVAATMLVAASVGGVAVVGAQAGVLQNAGFEDGPTGGPPDHWTTSAWRPSAVFTWDDAVAFEGTRSARIAATAESNDAAWIQDITLVPDTRYELSGWVRTDAVAGGDGANLGIWDTWTHSEGVTGTHDWTRVAVLFDSGPTGEVTVAARLGYWGGDSTGTAWFDGLEVRPVAPHADGPVPPWHVQVLIYPETDVMITDSGGTDRHIVASMTPTEIQQAVDRATSFLSIDVPALSSQMMVPEFTVEVVERTLTTVTPIGVGFDPGRVDTAPELDPGADAVIVVWDPRGTDQDTGESIWIGSAAGRTYHRGTAQAYLTIIAEGAVEYPHRNVFKHEFGHAILFFYEALGVSPDPTVNNHPQVEYVHCPTGTDYVWVDETLADPIPNSIYNNDSGFTHDYYSGTTADPADPTHCLGITRDAWLWGGPVTRAYLPPVITPGLGAVEEGHAGTTVLSVPVSLDHEWGVPVTVDWTTVDTGAPGIATAGDDYVAASGTVTFPVGAVDATVDVQVVGDVTDEPLGYLGEWIPVAFSNPSGDATIDPLFYGLGIGIVVDDDPPPVISPSLAGVTEGDSGSVVVDVPVRLSHPSAVDVTVDWTTVDTGAPGVAAAGQDYLAAAGTLTFPPGVTERHVPVTVLGDTLDEPPLYGGEWGILAFSNPTAGSIDPLFFGLGIFIIVDDDP